MFLKYKSESGCDLLRWVPGQKSGVADAVAPLFCWVLAWLCLLRSGSVSGEGDVPLELEDQSAKATCLYF